MCTCSLAGNALCGICDGLGRQFTAKGITAIADALKDNGSMTRLDVRVNYGLGEEGKALLRRAIAGRSGFELLL